MNLHNLFESQKKLDYEIELHYPLKEGEDRKSKMILSLVVNLGELADQWQGFKFWSNYQEPNTNEENICPACGGEKYIKECGENATCGYCNGEGIVNESNPLLEEYANCLLSILSIGNFIKTTNFLINENHTFKEFTIEKQFLRVMDYAIGMKDDDYYFELTHSFIHLGSMLGFTWEEIVQAYIDRTQVKYELLRKEYL